MGMVVMTDMMADTSHFPIPVNADGEGPVDPGEAVRYDCACGRTDVCPFCTDCTHLPDEEHGS
jgi:hypothetical protein